MSRAIFVDMTVVQVETLCSQQKIGISTIEALLSGGTRVVLDSSDGAATMRRVAKTQLIKGTVKRSPEFRAY